MPSDDAFSEQRTDLVALLARRIRNGRVLAAFARVPRHLFVPEPIRSRAYEDRALPLSAGQTISQPSMIALMLEALEPEPEHLALEVGAGSGYAAALLACLVREVHAVEIRPEFALQARDSLERSGITNVRIHVGDGSRGLPEHAPFDRILVSAGARVVPEELVRALSPGGRIAIPVGPEGSQVLRVGRRGITGEGIEWERSVQCLFVPLVGGEG